MSALDSLAGAAGTRLVDRVFEEPQGDLMARAMRAKSSCAVCESINMLEVLGVAIAAGVAVWAVWKHRRS